MGRSAVDGPWAPGQFFRPASSRVDRPGQTWVWSSELASSKSILTLGCCLRASRRRSQTVVLTIGGHRCVVGRGHERPVEVRRWAALWGWSRRDTCQTSGGIETHVDVGGAPARRPWDIRSRCSPPTPPGRSPDMRSDKASSSGDSRQCRVTGTTTSRRPFGRALWEGTFYVLHVQGYIRSCHRWRSALRRASHSNGPHVSHRGQFEVAFGR